MSNAIEISKEVMSLVRASALSRLRTYIQCPDFEIEEIKSETGVYGHWMSLILISGSDLRVTFKAHFSTKDAQKLAGKLLGKTPDLISEAQAADFMKEYCNLTGGGVKKYFEDRSQAMGISLPLVTRGFDELFFDEPNGVSTFEDAFVLSSPMGRIAGTVSVELFDIKSLDEFKYVQNQKSDFDDGGVDFL